MSELPPPWEEKAKPPPAADEYACGHKRSYSKRCLKCEGDRNRSRVEQMRELIIESKRLLTGGTDPETERVILHKLRAAGHPFPEEFVKSVTGGAS